MPGEAQSGRVLFARGHISKSEYVGKLERVVMCFDLSIGEKRILVIISQRKDFSLVG